MNESLFWPWSAGYAGLALLTLAFLAIVGRRRPGSERRAALAVALLTAVVYMTWRVAFTVPNENLAARIAGIVLVGVEILGLVQMVASTVIGWQKPIRRQRAAPADAGSPSVDILICTYSESATVLEPTLAGAMGILYDGIVKVHVCDDGSRPEIRDLANRYGAHYIDRDEHQHAKAGNLNNALRHTSGELVATLDADMIPTADFLEKTVGYFTERDLAFVQAPQAFHNQDAFQYNLFSGEVLPNEQDYFMRTLQPGKEHFNAVMYVGSNTVFRRSALAAIGGFATGVITEDMATGMLLQAAGYRGRFAPDIIAAGLAPESFGDLLTQRTRWARGNIQTARRWNPFTWPGLSKMQRWLYADGILYWHFGIFKFVFLLAPLVYLLGGIPVVNANVPSIVTFWLPYFVASFVSMGAVSQGRRSFTWTHVYEIAMAPTIAIAVIGEWVGFSTKVFAVTPKGVSTHKLNFRWGIAIPPLIFLALSVAALLNAFVFSAGSFRPDSLVITSFWAGYNIVGLVMAILVCLERPRQRRTERTNVEIPVAARLWPGRPVAGRILDLSFQGARIALPWTNNFDPTQGSRRLADIEDLLIDHVGTVTGNCRWVSETAEGMLVGFEFDRLAPAHAVAIMRAITASDDWVRHDREENARVGGAALRTLIGATRRVTPSLRTELRLATRGVAQLHRPEMSGGGQDEVFSVHVEDLSFGGCRVRSRQRLSSGEHYLLDFGEAHGGRSTAEVRWVQRRAGRYVAGLRLNTPAERSVRP